MHRPKVLYVCHNHPEVRPGGGEAYDPDICAVYSLSDQPSDDGDASDLGPLRRQELTRQIRDVVTATLPGDATVLVWAHAQHSLLELAGRRTEPFTQPAEGSPAIPDEDVIEELVARRRAGAEFLLVSATAFSWLDQRPRLKRHLEQDHRLAVEQRHLCRIYELVDNVQASEAAGRTASILGWLRSA